MEASRMFNRSPCPRCGHSLTPTDISFTGDVYYVCLTCKRVLLEDISTTTILPAKFKGKTDATVTKEFYDMELAFLAAYISHLGEVIHRDLSQGACHFTASLSLVLRSYADEARERIKRLDANQRERG